MHVSCLLTSIALQKLSAVHVYTHVGPPLSRWNSISFRQYHVLLEFGVKLPKRILWEFRNPPLLSYRNSFLGIFFQDLFLQIKRFRILEGLTFILKLSVVHLEDNLDVRNKILKCCCWSCRFYSELTGEPVAELDHRIRGS
jgi:hypothetical protein